MSLLAVDEALERIVGDVAPLGAERVSVGDAAGRVLAEDATAALEQPPFHASAMDGYAVRAADTADAPVRLAVVGNAAAGHGYAGALGAGETVRIFTGAPLPEGADAIVIQEDVTREGDVIAVGASVDAGTYVRRAGLDFARGQVLLKTGRWLNFRDVTLVAQMGLGELAVRRRPRVGILATGDELVAPGTTPGPDQIVSSTPIGLAGLIRQAGGAAEILGIARDTIESLDAHIAGAHANDILVTIGGASVGEHDLVQDALKARGYDIGFWRIAMRPGKPLMLARKGDQHVLGLPGNPVSALVCGRVFVVALVRAMLGLAREGLEGLKYRLTAPLEANGPRQHFMRGVFTPGTDGEGAGVRALESQDSSLLATLARADCLIVRPPHAPAANEGTPVAVLPLDF